MISIKKVIIIIFILLSCFLNGCNGSAVPDYSEIPEVAFNQTGEKLTKEETYKLIKDLDGTEWEEYDVLNNYDFYGGLPGDMVLRRADDNEIYFEVITYAGVIYHDGKWYSRDPFDRYFDNCRSLAMKHKQIYLRTFLDRYILEEDREKLYKVYGIFTVPVDMLDIEWYAEYPEAVNYSYDTYFAYGKADVKEILDFFGKNAESISLDELFLRETGNSKLSEELVNREIEYEGVKIKQIKDNIIPYNEVIGSYLLKKIN